MIRESYKYPDITNFIQSFLQEDENVQSSFLYGNCYWFAKILEQRFQHKYHCVLCYNQILNHFAVSIGDELFDASGLCAVYPAYHWIAWYEYKAIEPNDSYRVIRDCVLKTTDKEILTTKLKLLQQY